MMGLKSIVSVLSALIVAAAVYLYPSFKEELDPAQPASGEADVVIHFPTDRYPETGEHIREAIDGGEPATCTIDRDGADENREASLEGIPTRDGYDRDEWPMAMCAEGGEGASVAYIEPSDNRGAGSWVGNRLEEYPDGTKVLFIVD